MRFATGITLLSAATTQFQVGGEQVFKLNGIFDPDTTGGTHQPYGMDQMAALYARYIVHRVHVSVRVQNSTGNKTVGHAFSVQPSTGTTTMTGNSISDVLEKPQGSAIFPMPTGDTVEYEFSANLWDLEGITRAQWLANVEEYAALTSADPARIVTFRCGTANTFDNTQTSGIFIVSITYDVEFFDRQTLAASN